MTLVTNLATGTAGVLDTSGKFTVSTIPTANLPLVSTTTGHIATGINDTGGKFATGVKDTCGK
jgi:hypothetical protein